MGSFVFQRRYLRKEFLYLAVAAAFINLAELCDKECFNGNCITEKGQDTCFCRRYYYGQLCEKRCNSYNLILKERVEIELKDFASMSATNISVDGAGLKITLTFSKDDITIGMLNSSISEIPMISTNLLAIEDLNECETEVCFLDKQCSNELGSFQCNCGTDYNDENGLCIKSNSKFSNGLIPWIIGFGLVIIILSIFFLFVYCCKFPQRLKWNDEINELSSTPQSNTQSRIDTFSDLPDHLYMLTVENVKKLELMYLNQRESLAPFAIQNYILKNSILDNPCTCVLDKPCTCQIDDTESKNRTLLSLDKSIQDNELKNEKSAIKIQEDSYFNIYSV